MSVKLNVNIRTLLNNCEELSKHEVNHVRLQPLIDSLQNMIDELEQADSNCKHLPDYMKRLFSLKKDIGYLGRKDNSPSKENGLNESQSMESSQDMLRHSRQLQSSRVYMDLRKKLLPDTNEFGDGLRQRHTEANTEDEMVNRQTGASVKGRTDMNCENIADHMLSLTQSLREQTEIANRIIRSDTEVVSESNDAVDDNLYALNQESRKLLTHSSFDRNCWVWVMITVVLITFIVTVIFMKLVKKKSKWNS